MGYRYEINESECIIGEKSAKLYGISCFTEREKVADLTNLSEKKDQVIELIEKCNKFELDPIQLKDIADDYFK